MEDLSNDLHIIKIRMMNWILTMLSAALVFIQCTNIETPNPEKEQVVLKPTDREDFFHVKHNSSGEDIWLRYDEDGFFSSIIVIRGDDFTRISLDSATNISEWVKVDLATSLGHKAVYRDNIMQWIYEYEDFEYKTIGQELRISNVVEKDQSLYVFITEEPQHHYRFEAYAPYEIDRLNIVIGKVDNIRKFKVSDRLIDTTFSDVPKNIVLHVPKKTIEGFVSFGNIGSEDTVHYRPIYFRYPQHATITSLMESTGKR